MAENHLWNASEDLINGNELQLYLTSGKTVLAYATSCSLQVSRETTSTASKFSCRWSAVRGGNSSYQVSSDALFCAATSGDSISFDGLLALSNSDDTIEWYMGKEMEFTPTSAQTCDDNPHTLDTGSTYYYGEAIVTSVSLEANNGEVATCSITLEGSGPIYTSEGTAGGNG